MNSFMPQFMSDRAVADRISSMFGTARVVVSGVFGQRRKKLVLVAEREPATWNFINKLLSKINRHCEIVRLADGAQAFATACSRQPDLVIANPGLAGINGFRLVDNLKMDPQSKKIPVVLTTGLTRAALLTNLLTTVGGGWTQGALG